MDVAPSTGVSSTEEVGLGTTIVSSDGLSAMASSELIGLSTLVRAFLLITACDLSVSTERFGADLDRERAGSSKIRMGPNADRLDVVVDS